MASANGVMMSQEAVDGMLKAAEQIPFAVEHAKEAVVVLQSSFDERKDVLGPHTDDIESIIECINDAQKSSSGAVIKVQLGLVKGAKKLSDIINKRIKP